MNQALSKRQELGPLKQKTHAERGHIWEEVQQKAAGPLAGCQVVIIQLTFPVSSIICLHRINALRIGHIRNCPVQIRWIFGDPVA